MCCKDNVDNSKGDKLELRHERHLSNHSAVSWLVQHAVTYLNNTGQQAELSYNHVIDLLVRNEASDAVIQLLCTAPKSDVTLRWSLLYVLGDCISEKRAKWLVEYAVEPLPPKGEGCEGPRDGELLLRTMAIESIKKTAMRHPETATYLLKIIEQSPDTAVLIEAVKAALELGIGESVWTVLPKENHWMTDIRKQKAAALHADPERKDTKEVGYKPPKDINNHNSPSIKCCCKKGGNHHG
jgi:hypothetical protein